MTADAWYRALREWRTRQLYDEVPRGPKRSSGGAPARVVWGCPVCRSVSAAEVDISIIEARARGDDLEPVVRSVAQKLRVRESVVWRHARDHLDVAGDAPVIGEWSRTRRISLGEHVLTPAGWVAVDRITSAIRSAPQDVRERLDTVRYRRRARRTLLKPNGQLRGKEERLMAEALLWLAAELTSREPAATR